MKFYLTVLLICLLGCSKLNDQRVFIDNHQVNSINLEILEDGTYQGTYSAGFVSADVKVVVEKKMIKEIELLKHNEMLGDAGEEVIDRVLDEQNLGIDVISGATLSSKVILSAIENALAKK